MKNIILGLVLGLILAPVSVWGGIKIIKEYLGNDNFAVINQLGNDSGTVKLYKIDDPADPTVKCYVAVHQLTVYEAGQWVDKYDWRTDATVLSCVKVK